MHHRLRATGVATCALVASAAIALPSATTSAQPVESSAANVAPDRTSVTAPTPRKRRAWQPTFTENFDGNAIDTSDWLVYVGGQRRADNVKVSGGTLKLQTRRTNAGWTAAGVSSVRALSSRYGKYVIRARLDKGQGTRAVGLLWPTGGVWPPEIDFFEVAGDNPQRTKNLTANHYRVNGVHKIQQHPVMSDYTTWHRIGVIWTPTELTYLLDDKVVGVVKGQVPQRDMWLGLQTATGTGPGAPTAKSPDVVNFEIDWVRIFARS